MYRPISYEEQTVSAGRYLIVLRHFRVIGTIRAEDGDSANKYYHGSHNEVTPQLEDKNLDALKARIESQYSALGS